jgi:hypothetical protein
MRSGFWARVMKRKKRERTPVGYGVGCPSGREHGPLLKFESGGVEVWHCPHAEHARDTPPEIAVWTAAQVSAYEVGRASS